MRKAFLPLKKLYSRAHRLLLHTQLGRFLVVGGSAFTVNAILLSFFYALLGLPILAAQIISAEGTIVFSFVLHHHWTYRNYRKKPLVVRFFEFNMSALGGSVISTVSVIVCVQLLHLHYLVGLSIGAALAMSWNYFANLYFIWSRRNVTQVTDKSETS